MRITSLHLDGYGVFADRAIDDLPAGLSIVHGPNEAGKSTLLDFVRGVLFGFPDRRRRDAYHEPVMGGRHGGAIGLCDDRGQSFFLERFVSDRTPRLVDADGRVAEPSQLTRLLGGADDALFRSVFAFGLYELTRFESLEADEVRDLVFSAGVLGAGRSATAAQRALRQREEQLVRPRQQSARANALASELAEVEAALRAARAAAREYPAQRAALDERAAALASARAVHEARRVQIAELDRLCSCAPLLKRRAESEATLAGLGELARSQRAALGAEATIEGLLAGLSGYEKSFEDADRLANSLANIEIDLALHLEAAGGIAEEVALGAHVEPGRDREAASLERERSGHVETLRTLLDQLATERAQEYAISDELQHELATIPTRAAAELAAIAHDLTELRRNVAEQARVRAELEASRREARLASSEQRQGAVVVSPLLIAAGLLAALVLVLVGVGVASHPVLTGIGAGLVLAGLLGAFTAVRRRAPHSEGAHEGEDDARERALARLEDEAGPLRDRLGVDPAASASALDSLADRLETERDVRRRLDRRIEDLGHAALRRELAEAAVEHRREEIAAIDDRLEKIGREIGIEMTVGPDGLAALIGHLEAAQALAGPRDRTARGLARERETVAGYRARLDATVASVLGAAAPDDLEVRGRVAELGDALGEARTQRTRRERLEHTIAEARRDLETSLGADATVLHAPFEPSLADAWVAERDELVRVDKEAERELETLVKQHHDADRSLEERSRSGEIAALDTRAAGLVGELEDALESFGLYFLARTMLAETLARYERERQPAVIERAGALFTRVTDGRYTALVAREEGDGHRHGIAAIDARGSALDAAELSRGTAEQLYLCLRLAFAESFAKSSVALPLVVDDILVNFDPGRATAVAEIIAEVASEHQVLAFTCHPEDVERYLAAAPGARVVELEPSGT